MHAFVLADGQPPTRDALDAAWPGWDDDVTMVIAADGGVRLADALGLSIDRWVGDGDSLDELGQEALRRRGVRVTLAARDKDQTDTELALLAAIQAGATRVTMVGVLGGPRVDHALANVMLLGHPAASGRHLEILDVTGRIRLLAVPAVRTRSASGASGASVVMDLSGRVGAVISLVPLGDLAGVTTSGLQFALADAEVGAGSSRTISNVRIEPTASVSVRSGRLLVIESPATLAP